MGLLKASHRNISPIIVIMPTDIISVLQGASLHTIVKYARDCTNCTCHPILSPAVKSCSSSPRKSTGGKCKIILLMSNGRGQTSNAKSQRKIKTMSSNELWGEGKKKKKKSSGYYFLNKLDCLRHLFQMTRNMKMSRGNRESGVRMCLQAMSSHFSWVINPHVPSFPPQVIWSLQDENNGAAVLY